MPKTKDQEIAELRQAMAALIAENERMERLLKLIEWKSDVVDEDVDTFSIIILYEINLHAKEALK
ncbi:hypothetical protein [Bacillus sp. UNC125MFCrub1.1]|uniref:hypothetical protein n=1 Tax=Bacillus sp. UNC125MFCrub1.1 TaxID=1380371 RepID=UPI000691F2AA|nr:hypothetical protein [Bacillus sp. UNC125MFCrub1.1]